MIFKQRFAGNIIFKINQSSIVCTSNTNKTICIQLMFSDIAI